LVTLPVPISGGWGSAVGGDDDRHGEEAEALGT
jgi:hypothetical protein